jgi:superfamily II helicase
VSKTRSRSGGELNELRKYIKELEEELRNCKKEITILKKASSEQGISVKKEIQSKSKVPSECPFCENGKINTIRLPHGNLIICSNCKVKQVVKKDE